jgi:hypothetical protein
MIAELTVDRARTAARDGDLDRAAQLLTELDDTGELDPAGLDLLARVHGQRAEFAEADACWARLPDTDPDAVAGRAAVARIVAGRRRRPFWQPGRVLAVGVVAAGAVAAGGVGWARSLPPAGPDPAVVAAQQQLRAMERQAAAAHASQAAAATSQAKAIDQLAAALAMPGVHVRKDARSVEVLFDAGVFSYNDELSPSGATMLALMGARLRTGSVTVVGHAVPIAGGVQRGGSVLALARAVVAARELSRTSGRPLTAFALSTGDQAANPFSSPAANRTVTLIVSP